MADRSARIFDKMHRNRWQISRAAGERAQEKQWAARSGPVTVRKMERVDEGGESASELAADSEATVEQRTGHTCRLCGRWSTSGDSNECWC
jgi:hypothetical protein